MEARDVRSGFFFSGTNGWWQRGGKDEALLLQPSVERKGNFVEEMMMISAFFSPLLPSPPGGPLIPLLQDVRQSCSTQSSTNFGENTPPPASPLHSTD